ncbi:MAG: DUF1573 domain-containing protein [Bacteroidales bacterium]|nr:DUF1573 domain-containing protein [Bacteroidales bacterium]
MKRCIVLSVISCLLLISCNNPVANKAKIKFQTVVLDFGKIKAGDTISQTFDFVNIGNDTLLIVQVQPSCECTLADYSKAPVLPGNRGFINIKYASNKKVDIGKQIKTVIVQTNSDTLLTVLKVTGIVENDSLKKVLQQLERI